MLKKHLPTASYRLQFNANFPLKNAFDLVEYFRELGISDIYSSPLTKASPGSQHGYDVVDPMQLNPEICDLKTLKLFSKLIHRNKIRLLLDFVPNHMAASDKNKWWCDVLKNGRQSLYADYFDIDWKVKDKLSYRRFFDINELVCLRIEDRKVFEKIHTLLWKLIKNNIVDGLRIDHIDGLYDPTDYLVRLRKTIQNRMGKDLYIIVEKILGFDERISPYWNIEGTTGYDFLDAVNAIFVDKNGYQHLAEAYKQFTNLRYLWIDVRYRCKKQVIRELFHEETDKLIVSLKDVLEKNISKHIQSDCLKEVIEEISACLPIYRTYINTLTVHKDDQRYLKKAFKNVKIKLDKRLKASFIVLKSILTLQNNFQTKKTLKWIMQWQQFTGPIMAKGFEDTASYIYNPLTSLNEVGSDPQMEKYYGETDVFHKFLKNRQRCSPYSLNATSTHDTKRSEDVRMRLNVLSELSLEFIVHLKKWSELVQPLKLQLDQTIVPDPNFEILLYQSLLGAWPISIDRLKTFTLKVIREAKTNSSWKCPNPDYENALLYFVEALLENEIFLNSFLPFQKKIAFYGALNSLSSTLIKIVAPGVPDFYQGTETWSYTLVDPDNRAPVNFSQIMTQFNKIKMLSPTSEDIFDLCKNWPDGQIKLFLIQRALQYRQRNSDIFKRGRYLPLHSEGCNKLNVFSFCRVHKKHWILVAVPRFTTQITSVGKFPLNEVWGDTKILLPKNSPANWVNILTEHNLKTEAFDQLYLPLNNLLSNFPVAFFSST